MLRQIRKFLHSFFQRLLPVRRSNTGQTTQQVMPEQQLDNLRSVSATKKGLPETDKIPVMLLPIQDRPTRPHRAIVRSRQPANRYHDLDIMLTEIKRDRLDKTQTTLIARPVQHIARQLQRKVEQEEMKK